MASSQKYKYKPVLFCILSYVFQSMGPQGHYSILN